MSERIAWAVLAERAGLSLRGIQHLEAGAGVPYPDTARRLADALGLTGDTRAQFASAARPTSRRRDRGGRHAPTGPPAQDRVVGRSVELAQLRGALREAAAGHGRIVLVTGEPGIGKSRVVEELAGDASSFGVRACWGMCWEGESTPPFWPWVQLIRQYGRAHRATELAAELDAVGITYLLPELALDNALPIKQSTEQDRFWLFDAITRFFIHAAVAGPLLLILEDLHWSDSASLLLLRFFARQLRDSPILVVGTYRDTEVGPVHPVSQLAERCGDQVLALQGRALRLGDLLDVGDMVTFRLEAEFYDRQTRKLRQTRQLWHVPLIQATLAALEGRFEEAERLVGGGLQLGLHAQHPGVLPAAQAVFGMIRLAQGRATELEGQIRESVPRDPALLAWRSSMAYVLCEAGRDAEARLQFEALAVDDFSRVPRDFTWTGNLALLALTSAWLAERSRAELLYALMLPYAAYAIRITRFGAACFGSMSHYLGLLAGTLDRWDDAVHHFEEAIQMNTRLGAPPFVANSRYRLARALRGRGLPEDQPRAAEELRHAHAIFEMLGIHPQLRNLT